MAKERRSIRFLVPVLSLVLSAGVVSWGEGVESGPTSTAPTSGASAGEGASIGGSTPDDYVIQVDDVLMLDDGKLRSELTALRGYRVAKDGTIKLIYLGRQQAAGLTKRKLEDKIEKLYDPKYFKNLSITIDVASYTFTIGGEVRSPGVKPLLSGMTIQGAIASAGWFTDFAKESKVIVTRVEDGKRVQKIIDVNDILKGKVGADFLIKPKDDIFVPRGGPF